HIGGPCGLIPRDPQTILQLECWGAAHHQRRNIIKIEICLRTEVHGETGKCRQIVKLCRRIPSRGRREHVRIAKNQSESTVSRLAETDQKALRALCKRVAPKNEVFHEETLHPQRWIQHVVPIPRFVVEGGCYQGQVEAIGDVEQPQLFQAVTPCR